MSRTEVWSLNYSYWSLLFEVRGQYLPRRRRDLTIFHVIVLSWAVQLWRESLVARRIKTGTRMVPLRWHSTQRLTIQRSSQQTELYVPKLSIQPNASLCTTSGSLYQAAVLVQTCLGVPNSILFRHPPTNSPIGESQRTHACPSYSSRRS